MCEQALLWFRQEALALPSLEHERGVGGSVKWPLPVYNTIHRILCNPIYAGAYAFGRTATRTRVVDGRAHKTRGHRRPREGWIVLLREHHEGYIDWDTYERNRRLIADNAQMKGVMVRGAAREGRSLLAGLLRCSRCGRKLHVAYSGVCSATRCAFSSAASIAPGVRTRSTSFSTAASTLRPPNEMHLSVPWLMEAPRHE